MYPWCQGCKLTRKAAHADQEGATVSTEPLLTQVDSCYADSPENFKLQTRGYVSFGLHLEHRPNSRRFAYLSLSMPTPKELRSNLTRELNPQTLKCWILRGSQGPPPERHHHKFGHQRMREGAGSWDVGIEGLAIQEFSSIGLNPQPCREMDLELWSVVFGRSGNGGIWDLGICHWNIEDKHRVGDNCYDSILASYKCFRHARCVLTCTPPKQHDHLRFCTLRRMEGP